MILIADSGSSKADWVFVEPGTYTHEQLAERLVTSIGVNPNVHSQAEIRTVLEGVCPVEIAEAKLEEVHYYGTGIWDERRAQQLSLVLGSLYPNAQVEVHHDLLGAARAACKSEAGVACILGTGSNSCLYDGERVTDNVQNLGWLLGDEGSGVDLGKRLIRAYAYRDLSTADREWFEEQTGYNRTTIGNSLYGASSANRFLASFSPFLHDSLDRPAFRGIVEAGLRAFLRTHVLKYAGVRELPVNFVGSIAYHYAEVLREVCAAEGLRCGSISKKPIFALVDYHLSGRAA